jgi:hypothetical protein
MTQPHPIDEELLTVTAALPATEPTEDDVAESVVAYLFDMAAEPPAGSEAARILQAYIVGGGTAAIEEIASMVDVNDDRLRDMLLGQAAATVSARCLIEQAQAR